MVQTRCTNPNIKQRKKEKRKIEKHRFTTGWKSITTSFNRSNQMLTQTSNKEKKKQRSKLHHHKLKTHHHELIQLNQMRKPKHQTKKKKEKKKMQTSHHQSLIRCKRCEIPYYYQQIRYINSSYVKNTFGFLWKILRKRSGRSIWLAREALHDCDMAAWVGWARIGEIVHEEVRAGDFF